MRKEVFCPICERAGIKRKLLEVDSKATGIIYPWCKAHKENVRIELGKMVKLEASDKNEGT